MDLEVRKVVTGAWRENCYLVSDAFRRTVIIDPGDDFDSITVVIDEFGLEPCAILATHGHHDHVGAVLPMKLRYDVPFYLHSADAKLLKRTNFYRKLFDKAEPVEIAEVDVWLDGTRELELGEFRIGVLETPGHTPGGVSFAFGDALFSGDVLLRRKVGRVDLPGGKQQTLAESLRRLAELPPATCIYPGHGDKTLLAEELASNPQLRELLA